MSTETNEYSADCLPGAKLPANRVRGSCIFKGSGGLGGLQRVQWGLGGL